MPDEEVGKEGPVGAGNEFHQLNLDFDGIGLAG